MNDIDERRIPAKANRLIDVFIFRDIFMLPTEAFGSTSRKKVNFTQDSQTADKLE